MHLPPPRGAAPLSALALLPPGLALAQDKPVHRQITDAVRHLPD